MGAASFLASVARHSLVRPVRHEYSKFAASEVHNIALIDPEQPAGALQLLSSFHMDLAERLQQLQLHGTGNAHFNWLFDALASTLSTHSSLQLALTAAASTCAAALAKHRADEVLCMLDACTSLKEVADDMDRQLGCLDHALQSVGHAINSEKPLSSGRLRAAARRLSACLMQDTNLLCVTGKHYRPLAEARDSLLLAAKKELQRAATPDLATTLLSQAIDGALLTSLLVLASAVSSHSPPSRRKSSGIITSACKMIIKYLGAKRISAPWVNPLRQLHRDLRQEEMSAAGGALFQERQGLHFAATKLQATITTPGVDPIELAVVKQSVKSLRKSLREAQACITVFRMQMASFFQALIALRLTLLDA